MTDLYQRALAVTAFLAAACFFMDFAYHLGVNDKNWRKDTQLAIRRQTAITWLLLFRLSCLGTSLILLWGAGAFSEIFPW
jgi:hypothetical protein